MKAFFDSSALAKRYISESGSQEVEALLQQATALGVSVIVVPELFSALNRRRREDRLSESDYAAVRTQIAEDITDADTVQLDAEVLARSVRLLEVYPLRALDALHVACALLWQAELFISSDQRQLAAAKEEKLAVKAV